MGFDYNKVSLVSCRFNSKLGKLCKRIGERYKHGVVQTRLRAIGHCWRLKIAEQFKEKQT